MTSSGALAYQFGTFRLDPAERLLLRGGQPVSLTPKAFDLLVYLAERPGKLVEKSALMTALWPDLAISPDGTSLLYDRPVNFHANLWMLENFR
jgi:DNA-binding winged helix-turn-helix (wHTH) protein